MEMDHSKSWPRSMTMLTRLSFLKTVVSPTFNVADLSPFFDQEGKESRMTPFEGGDDEHIPGSPRLSSSSHDKSQLSNEASTNKTYLCPMTSSYAKQIEQEVNVGIMCPTAIFKLLRIVNIQNT